MSDFNFGTKKVLFKEGEKATKLYLIKSGEVLCLKRYKDRNIPVYLAKEGDIVGESAMIDNSKHIYSAVTLGAVESIEITSLSFRSIFNKSPEWIINLIGNLIERLRDTSTLMAENRVIHDSIIEEDRWTPQFENEIKKLLLNKTE